VPRNAWRLSLMSHIVSDAVRCSGDGKTRRVGLSGFVASLVVAVPCVTRRVTGRRVRALGMICPCVCGGAGLVPAAGLIRSLSALWA